MEGEKKISKRKRLLHLEHWQIISIILVVYDILAVSFAYVFASWIRSKYSGLCAFGCAVPLLRSIWSQASYSAFQSLIRVPLAFQCCLAYRL